MTARFEATVETLQRWNLNPQQFVVENFNVQPDRWQAEALDAYRSTDPAKQRISLQACVGPGKSAVLAWCGWHFLSTFGDKVDHPKGACVSITAENLRDNLWAEFAKWQACSPYLSSRFVWTSNRIFARGSGYEGTWFLSARAWPKTGNADEQGKTLSGLHSRYVLAMCDESGAIPPTVLRAAEQALSNCEFGKILQAGNPITTDGMLYAAASPLRHLWHVVAITGDPDDPKRAPRVDLAWAKQQIATYGRDNPWVQSYILGRFPAVSFNTLLSVEEVEAAMHRHYARDAYAWAQKRLGNDVARFGDDRTVIFPRQGLVAWRPVVLRNKRTTDIAARIAMAIEKWGPALVLIDDTGHWGHGVVDNLLAEGTPVIPIIMSDPAINPRYKNRRVECWLGMADWIKKGGALPYIPELVAELTQPTYSFVGGKFMLEDKDFVKKRLGRSPDLADALSTTFAIPDMPADVAVANAGRNKVEYEFDPYAEPVYASGAGHVVHEFNPFEER